jgi:hypothetical protein
VMPVVVPTCQANGAAACGLDKVAFLALSGTDRNAAALVGRPLGFEPVAVSGPVVLLGRSSP